MGEIGELTRAYEHEKFAQAKERMEDITAFYVHLAAFVTFMLVMLQLDILDGDDLIGPLDWVFWPFLGWGIGLLGHAWAVYGYTPRVIADWQDRKIQNLTAKM